MSATAEAATAEPGQVREATPRRWRVCTGCFRERRCDPEGRVADHRRWSGRHQVMLPCPGSRSYGVLPFPDRQPS